MTLSLRLFVLFMCAGVPIAATSQDVIAVRVVGGAILVPVRIDDRTFNFMLDTGSQSSSIDPATASELKLATTSTKRIQKNFRELIVDATEVGPLRALNADFPKVELAEVNLAPLSKALGTAVDGVLGLDILQNICFKLSYSHQTLTVGTLAKLGVLGTALILRPYGGQFLVSTALMSISTDLVLDTGTNSTNLSAETWGSLTKNWTPSQVVEGIQRAGNPTSPAILACLPSIRIGGITLTNQAVRAQTRSDAGAFSTADFGGILGSDVLRQFEITFDLKKDTIYLAPDRQFTIDPYRYTTVGIQIARNDDGALQIMSVWKNSPAAKAGLLAGDLIRAINNRTIDSQPLEQVSSMLHAKAGTEVKLEILRDSTPSTIKVLTETLLCKSEPAVETLRR